MFVLFSTIVDCLCLVIHLRLSMHSRSLLHHTAEKDTDVLHPTDETRVQ